MTTKIETTGIELAQKNNELKKVKRDLEIAKKYLNKLADKKRCQQITNCQYRGTSMTCLECSRLIAQQGIEELRK